jgi:hypothetical protein
MQSGRRCPEGSKAGFLLSIEAAMPIARPSLSSSTGNYLMSTYDDQYYFLVQPREDDKKVDVLPVLTPGETIAKLPFEYEALPIGTKPLMFINGASDLNKKYGRTTVKNPPPVLFFGNYPVVSSGLREKLLKLKLPNIALQPAIYIDDWGTWHENYWFITFTDRLDCWSRTNSNYEQGIEPIRLGGFELYQIYEFSLDEAVLDRTPKAQRLLFQMGGAQEGFIVAQQSVAALFAQTDGVQVLGIQDYPDKY